jgi:hypothetical protein
MAPGDPRDARKKSRAPIAEARVAGVMPFSFFGFDHIRVNLTS